MSDEVVRQIIMFSCRGVLSRLVWELKRAVCGDITRVARPIRRRHRLLLEMHCEYDMLIVSMWIVSLWTERRRCA